MGSDLHRKGLLMAFWEGGRSSEEGKSRVLWCLEDLVEDTKEELTLEVGTRATFSTLANRTPEPFKL